ncbi:hypothetical protein GN956_G20952 [Arapaima gigas]
MACPHTRLRSQDVGVVELVLQEEVVRRRVSLPPTGAPPPPEAQPPPSWVRTTDSHNGNRLQGTRAPGLPRRKKTEDRPTQLPHLLLCLGRCPVDRTEKNGEGDEGQRV